MEEIELKETVRRKVPDPELTGDFWKDREQMVGYALAIGYKGEELRQYLAAWEGDAVRRCDRLYYR